MLRGKKGTVSIGAIAIVVAFLIVASCITVVVSEYNRLSAGARRESGLASQRAKEKLSVVQLSTTQIHVVNEGSTPSLLVAVYTVNPVDNNLKYYSITPTGVSILGERTITIPHATSEQWKVGVLTQLGNMFWETPVTTEPRDVVFTQSGLLEDTSWSVILAGEEKKSTSETITFEDVLPGTYTWSAETPITCDETNYYAFPPSGVLHVPAETEQLIQYSDKCTLSISVSSDVTGTTDPEPGNHPYDPGSSIEVTATPFSGCSFDHWELDGEDAGSANPITIVMDAPHSLEAVFTGQPTTITFYVKSGLGSDALETAQVLTIEATTHTMSDLPVSVSCGVGTYLDFSWISPVGSSTEGKCYAWSSTGGLSTEQTGTISVEAGGGAVYSEYKTQHRLSVSSDYGEPTGEGWYDSGSTASSSVSTPVAGDTGVQYACVGWTGTGSAPSSGSGASVSFTIEQPSSVTWNWKTQYWLTTRVNPLGAGSVSPNSGFFDAGEEVAISATPGEENEFLNWEGSGAGSYSGEDNPATVTMNEPITETANFLAESLTITFSTTNLGGDAPGTILTVDSTDYNYGDLPLDLTVDVDSTLTFEWYTPIGVDSGKQYVWTSTSGLSSSRTDTITVTEDGSIVGNYKTQYYLTMQANTGGSVSPSGGWRDAGENVEIEATPNEGYAFDGWIGSGSGSYTGSDNPKTITMNGPITETASFKETKTTVTFKVSGVSGDSSGTVLTVDITHDYGYGDFPVAFEWNIGSSHSFEWHDPVGAGSGKQYVWFETSGLSTGRSGSIVVPSGGGSVTGKYKTQYYLTMQANPHGSVSPGSGWRDAGSSVQISATPDSGYEFTSWVGSGSGSYSGSNNPATVTMNGPITETASFELASATVTFSVSGVGGDASDPVLTVDSVDYYQGDLSKSFDWSVGSSHDFEWHTPVGAGSGKQYVWFETSGLSTGRSGSIVVPSGGGSVTGKYKTQYKLTMQVNPSGAGSTSPSIGDHWYNLGQHVTIRAYASGDYTFCSWSGSGSGSYSGSNNPATVTMNGPITQSSCFAGDIEFPGEDIDADIHKFSATSWEECQAATPVVVRHSSIVVGVDYIYGQYVIYRGYISFDTSSIPDGATITSATLSLQTQDEWSTEEFGVVIYSGNQPLWGDFYPYPEDWGCGTYYEGVLLNTANYPGGVPKKTYFSMGVSTSHINKQGRTQYELRSDKEWREPTDEGTIAFYSGYDGRRAKLEVSFEFCGEESTIIIEAGSTNVDSSSSLSDTLQVTCGNSHQRNTQPMNWIRSYIQNIRLQTRQKWCGNIAQSNGSEWKTHIQKNGRKEEQSGSTPTLYTCK